MDRRAFLKGLLGGGVGLAAVGSGLVEPEDWTEPVKRFWQGWRPGLTQDSPLFFTPPGQELWLMAGDSIQFDYTYERSGVIDSSRVAVKQSGIYHVLSSNEQAAFGVFHNGRRVYGIDTLRKLVFVDPLVVK